MTNNQIERCPICRSLKIGGLIASFWVPISDGEPDGTWVDWESNTELTSFRICYDCGYEWEDIG